MLTYTGDGRTLSMSYDALRRLSSVTGGVYERKYLYRDIGSGKTTSQVSSLTYKNPAGAAVYSYSYTYDVLGNIASYTDASGTQVYEYDAQSQLKKVTNTSGNVLYQYTYDNAGNILTANGKTYTYGNAVWKDLLTKYDGQSIAYEGQTISGNTVTGTIKSGNPISYYNGTRWDFTWKEGRNLVSADGNVYSIDYTYDLNGLRTSKKVGNVTHNYYYAGGKLLRETYGSNTLDFFYDQSGYPYALKYNGTLYYYITNLQGDVLHLTNANGTVVVSYTYDPYGKPLDTTGTMATTLGAVNPLRYRGYYYDTETGFYYLQSRYYDPAICRFINADAYASTGQGIIGCNMFAYCLNNPIIFYDYNGERIVGVGIQFEMVVDNVSIGIEAILYLDPTVCNGGGPVIAIYTYSGVSLDLNDLNLDEVKRQLRDLFAYTMVIDGTSEGHLEQLSEQALLAILKSFLNDNTSNSCSVFLIFGNDNFESAKSYSGRFDSVSATAKHWKVTYATSPTCSVLAVGKSSKFLDFSYSYSYYSEPILLTG